MPLQALVSSAKAFRLVHHNFWKVPGNQVDQTGSCS